MRTKDKLIERFKKQPKDFSWDEIVRIFKMYGFEIDNRGKTSGSRIRFKKYSERIELHKPHPSSIVKEHVMKQALGFLIEKGYLNIKN